MLTDKVFLERFRRIIIELLNALDDALGLPRTVPPKSQRRKMARQRAIDVSVEKVV